MQILDVAAPFLIRGKSSPYCFARFVSCRICSGGICGARANSMDVVVISHKPGRIGVSAALPTETMNNSSDGRIFRIESF